MALTAGRICFTSKELTLLLYETDHCTFKHSASHSDVVWCLINFVYAGIAFGLLCKWHNTYNQLYWGVVDQCLGALRAGSCRFESHSSRHVGPLGKFFTHSCL